MNFIIDYGYMIMYKHYNVSRALSRISYMCIVACIRYTPPSPMDPIFIRAEYNQIINFEFNSTRKTKGWQNTWSVCLPNERCMKYIHIVLSFCARPYPMHTFPTRNFTLSSISLWDLIKNEFYQKCNNYHIVTFSLLQSY